MENDESPIELIFNEINKALEAELYYIALSTVLTLPDICASLKASDGKTSPRLYKKWCNQHIGQTFSNLRAEDMYSLRCGMSHNGRFRQGKDQRSRAVFILPSRGNVIKDSPLYGVYSHSIQDFCTTMIQIVHEWYEKNKDDENLKKNLDRMVRYRPEGYPPFVVGTKVLS